MDDIMILMNRINIDIQGFDNTQFGIFDDSDQEELLQLWNTFLQSDEKGSNVNKFIGKLSPEQKHRLTLWACNRTSYDIQELISALEKFTKYLKSSTFSKHQSYPKLKKK